MNLKATRYEVDGPIATITLARPKRRNAWTGRMHTELRWSLHQAEQDDSIRVILITGEGDSFCVGADFQALEAHSSRGSYDAGTSPDMADPGYGVRPEFDADFAYFFGIPKPIIAVINGAAAGVGLVIACYSDLRLAVAGAKLTTAHGRLNLPAEYGLSWLLPRMIGLSRANDVLLSSRVILAEEAYEWGLVNAVHEKTQLWQEALDLAQSLVNNVSPGSLASTKTQIYSDLHLDAASAVNNAAVLLERMVAEPDFTEGVAAWLEKRPARWFGQ